MDLNDVKGRVRDIKDYADELMNAYEELWDSYIEVSQERDELLEKVKELEGEEEAEKAVEKLKAWKRLKDKGFRFRGLCESVHELPAIEYDIDVDVSRIDSQEYKDLDLIFGGEE